MPIPNAKIFACLCEDDCESCELGDHQCSAADCNLGTPEAIAAYAELIEALSHAA